MINENIIVRLLDDANKQQKQKKEQYELCTNDDDRQIYLNAYFKSFHIYHARYQMLLCFGYDVVFDENNNIIGIKTI